MNVAAEVQAVFACNDQMALGLMRAACKLGKRIPEDLVVPGFDDIPEAAFFFRPLTAIRQDLYQLGHIAVQTFAHMREAEQMVKCIIPTQTLRLQPQIVIREST